MLVQIDDVTAEQAGWPEAAPPRVPSLRSRAGATNSQKEVRLEWPVPECLTAPAPSVLSLSRDRLRLLSDPESTAST